MGVINHAKKLIKVKDIYDFIGDDYDDPKVWDLIGSRNISGLFQIGSNTYKQRMWRLQPRTIKELAACLALVRGPCIASKADEKYMRILEGKEEIEKIHPIYDDITKETNGILIYQEQLMKICFAMGFTLDEGYKIMKLSSKKKIQELKEYEDKFMAFAKKKEMDDETAHRIFKMIVDTGLYSFNEAHGIGYAILCYVTAYLKLYYPKEFFIASLTNLYEKKEPVKDIVADCRKLGYKFTNLDLNKSKWEFTNEKDEYINIGFCAVKSFGLKAYYEIEEKRPFINMEDFLNRITKANCTKRAIIPAIFSGAFSCFDTDRINMYELYCDLGEYEIEEEIKIQGSKNTIKIHDDYSKFEKAYMEEPLTSDVANNLDAINIDNININSSFEIKGIISKVKKHIDKNKKEMAFLSITTGDGILDCTIFANKYEEYKSYIKKNKMYYFNLKKQNGEKYIINDIQLI